VVVTTHLCYAVKTLIVPRFGHDLNLGP
jgi:hypothetical protein